MSPLQLQIVKREYLCFYRQVWHDNNRYIQGFVANSRDFFATVANSLFSESGIDHVRLSYQNQDLMQLNFSSHATATPLYRRFLNPPFERLELRVQRDNIGTGRESRLVDVLAASIAITLIAGLLFLYRLLSRQIEVSRQQQNFISAVSHELKTPLTSIRMYGEMLRSGWVGEERKKQQYYDYIFFESERLSRLIANVLQLARIDHHTHHPQLNTLPVSLLLSRIPGKINAQISASTFRVTIHADTTATPPRAVQVDEDAFFQMMINLVDNAVKFAADAERQEIEIGYRLAKKAQQAMFYVRDFGPGINKRQQDKIFQLFYRPGDELTRATPGTGIGLALVAQLAESMQARVSVVNRQPGAEFQIRFTAIPLQGD